MTFVRHGFVTVVAASLPMHAHVHSHTRCVWNVTGQCGNTGGEYSTAHSVITLSVKMISLSIRLAVRK